MAAAASEQSSFCLQSNIGMLQLKRTHQHFYEVQTQLFVTRFLGVILFYGPQVILFRWNEFLQSIFY